MSESQSPDLRIGDNEREEALRVLGEHMTVGRLNPDEYGERAARVTAAKTRGELTELFADLPLPHPSLDGGPQTAAGSEVVPAQRRPMMSPRVTGALVPLSGILALALFFAVPGISWVVFLLPAAMIIITGALSQRH